MSISEYHLYQLVERIFKDYCIFPPSTVKSIDFIIARDVILLEVKSKLIYAYKVTKQLIALAKIAKLYNVSVILVAPIPENIYEAIAPILYFFKTMQEYKISQKEIWLIELKRMTILRIKLKEDKPIQYFGDFKYVIVDITLDKKDLLRILSTAQL